MTAHMAISAERKAEALKGAESTSGPRKLSLRKNFSWTLAGQMVYSFTAWAILMVLAKLGDPAQVGLVVLAQAICIPVVWLSSLNLRAALVTDARNEYTYGHYIGLRLLTSLLGFVVILGMALLPGYDWQTKWVLIVFALETAVLSVREIVVGIAIKNECMNISARSEMLLGLAALGGFAATYSLSGSLVAALGAILAARTGVLLLHDLPMARWIARTFRPSEAAPASLRPHWSFRMLRRLSLTALPLGLAMTLSSLNNSIPVYFLEGYHGKDATGFYGAMASLMNALMLFMNTLGTATSPRLALYFAGNRPAFKRLLGKLLWAGLAGGAVATVGAYLWGRPILAVLFRPEYAEYAGQFVWLIAAAGVMFLVSFLIYALIAARAFAHLMVSFAVVTGACAGISAALVKPWGVPGTVWTRLATAVIALGVLAAALWLRFRAVEMKADSPVASAEADASAEEPALGP